MGYDVQRMSDQTPSDPKPLLDHLRERDEPCPTCGYNLRALREPKCPECGSGLALTVGVVHPYVVPWACIVLCTGITAGVGLLLVLFAVRTGGLPRMGVSRDNFGRLYQGALLYFISTIPLVPIMVLSRVPFLRLNHARQRNVAILVAGVTIVTLGVLVVATFMQR